ncbi:MAG: putative lipid II flippase FtsW [Deltaproteobacteria bacterium]|nr:MAG: putative lipid II flippase FtsW [Deltaproteobacteria bacterium]
MTGKKDNTNPTLKRHTDYDFILMVSVLFLVGIGIIMVYSASSALAIKKFGNDSYFLKKQSILALLGFGAMMICSLIPYRVFSLLAYPLLISSLVLLIATQVTGFGYSAGGSLRWLQIGNLTFQPSEFARFAIVIYLAYSMSKKKENLKEFNIGFLPHILVLSIFIFLILIEPDFGSVVILAAITWIMLFVGGVPLLHLSSALVVVLPFFYIFLVNSEYRIKRLIGFMSPWECSSAEGYQITHSLMAFGTGGIWGTGIGNGYQKLFYLPEPHTDFIFSVIGEELGLWGILLILGLYMVILWRGVSIAKNAKDHFGSFAAIGLTIMVSLQVCVNMGVALGLLPTKGLTLPFLSYGGTSLLFNMASIGILLNIGTFKSRGKQRRLK